MKALLVIMLSYLTIWSVGMAAEGYVTDSSGKIVQTGSGLCLHTGTYVPTNAVKGCDPVAEVKRTPMTLNGDVLFEFDSSALTVKGREVLNPIIKSITTTSIVTIIGHTDRIGTSSYNQKLSQQRAQAVADYLNFKTGFKSKFVVSGVGSTQPTSDTALCTGMKNFEKFKSCLSPDRRVVITIQ
jgi:outer membrane protein OmpA-like peptidoglycan-associated protein